ncbi:unnamed protein product [Pleuronectes platessa]|uniref:BEACH domain-containing protein n=1 Tax=Pleuronectes platessa TaxID=8262 RepID=A0A9N7UF34_PLEPL|nr:unnamed protein product [Pleuronectes platessa]
MATALHSSAVESQIRSFGQTPCQLLIEPHPPRSSAMQVTPLMFTEQMQQDVIMVLKFPSNSPVTHVAANTQPGLTSPAIITVTANRLFAVNKWHGLAGHQSSTVQDQQYQLPVEIDPLIASNVGSHRRQISDLLDQSIQISSQCFIITADNRFILLCGFWDKSFRVYSTDSGKLTQIVFGHRDVVTCLARSESYIGGDCYVLSGSRDATLLLWYWNGKHSSIGESLGTEFTTPRAILTGHDCEVTCASVCAELGVVISGCKEGPCLIHSMNGDLLRTLEVPERCTAAPPHPVLHRGTLHGLLRQGDSSVSSVSTANCWDTWRRLLSGQIASAAAAENIPEQRSALDTDTINYPPAQDDTFPTFPPLWLE